MSDPNEPQLDPCNLPPGLALGPYFVHEFIAEGGMALVYKGFDPGLERVVALKMLKPEFACQQEHVERFQTEARAIAALRHPHIVPIHYIGKIQGIVFFAMDFLEGDPLDNWVERRQLVPPEQGQWILYQAVSALQAALAATIIHLDIKPGNLMLDTKNCLYLTDFGLAESVVGNRDTEAEAFGTLDYTAPEQFLREPTDHRTDIYSLGCTMFHLMVGSPPFTGDTAEEIAMKHVQKETPFPRDLALKAFLPEPWVNLLQKMMEKDPADRFQTYEELEEALRNIDTFKYVLDPKTVRANTSPRIPADILMLFGILKAIPDPEPVPELRAAVRKIETNLGQISINKMLESLRRLTEEQTDPVDALLFAITKIQGLEYCLRAIGNFMEEGQGNTAPARLVEFVGPERVQSYATVFFAINHETIQFPYYNSFPVWQHQLAVGALVDFLYDALDLKRSGCEFAAGVFHDMGKLILMELFPVFYGQLIGEGINTNARLSDLEKTYFGSNHAQILGMWAQKVKLPPALVKAWTQHESNDTKPQEVLTHAIISANHLIKQIGVGFSGNSFLEPKPWAEIPSTKIIWEARGNKAYDYDTFIADFLEQTPQLPELL